MSTKTAPTTDAASPATKAHNAATRATQAAAEAVQPASANLAGAREALAAAEAEAFEAITVKSADPAAARERIEKARAAIKTAEDNVTWSVLELHAREVQHEEAHAAEQVARRAVTAAEYQRAHQEWNDPENRERQLLAQLESIVAELIPLSCERKDLHDRLASEYLHLPDDEKPRVPNGQPITTSPTRLIGEWIQDLTPETVAAIKAGTATAQAELAERQRQAQFG